MFWSSRRRSDAAGSILRELRDALASDSIDAVIDGRTLKARQGQEGVRIEVRLASCASPGKPAPITLLAAADLPRKVRTLFVGREADAAAAWNARSAIGAIYESDGTVRVGARLTLQDGDGAAWHRLHLPLLQHVVRHGAAALTGSLLARTTPPAVLRRTTPSWNSRDLDDLRRNLDGSCTLNGMPWGAVIGIDLPHPESTGTHKHDRHPSPVAEPAPSAAVMDPHKATLELRDDFPHPELGHGLSYRLRLPRSLHDRQPLHHTCLVLNGIEMARDDLPPHVGAWCPDADGRTPAYVAFLPDSLRERAPGIAAQLARWAVERARVADGLIASVNG